MKIKAEVRAAYKTSREIAKRAPTMQSVVILDALRDALAEAEKAKFFKDHRIDKYLCWCNSWSNATDNGMDNRHDWDDERWRREAERRLSEP
jgi:hypothetical protein